MVPPIRAAAFLCLIGGALGAVARRAPSSAFTAARSALAPRTAPLLADVLVGAEQEYITISPAAMAQLRSLKQAQPDADLVLRMGVRSGGCSGMSYVMDMIAADSIDEHDLIIEYAEQGLRCVIDPKSSMYLYGLQLDYSHELIGGGFGFKARARARRAARRAGARRVPLRMRGSRRGAGATRRRRFGCAPSTVPRPLPPAAHSAPSRRASLSTRPNRS
jgi:iron-sulfur cluster assembly protein